MSYRATRPTLCKAQMLPVRGISHGLPVHYQKAQPAPETTL
jgi:hypothetical protein